MSIPTSRAHAAVLHFDSCNARRRACASSPFRPSARMRRFLSSTLATRTSSSRVVSMPISSVQSLGPAYSSSRRRPAVVRASVLFQQARQLTAKLLAFVHFRPDARLSTTAALLQCLYYAWHDLFFTTEVLRVYPCGASYEAALRSVLTPDSLELEVGAKPLHALTFSIYPVLFVHSPACTVSRARTVHQFNNGPRRPVQWGGAGAPKLL